VAALVASLLDNTLYIPSTWWPALYLGVLLGAWARHYRTAEEKVRYAEIGKGFDLAAERYDDEVGGNPAMAFMRRVSVETLLATFEPGQRVLEIGCGTGEEAIQLARAGISVLATDLSPAMVAIAAQKAADAGLEGRIEVRQLAAGQLGALLDDLGEGAFDGAYSSFGPLNGEPDLSAVGKALFRLVRPGGRVLASVMNRFYALEAAWYLLHGHPRQAVRRWGGTVMAGVSPSLPTTIPTWYTTPRAFARAFKGFERERCRALPLLLPPPYLAHLWARMPERARRWEERWSSRWPFFGLGDHFLMVLKRKQD
jgi:SAM-dependent methyltransferase